MKILASITLLSFMLLPFMASAQGGLVPCDGTDCTACDLVQLGETVLNLTITVMLTIFSIIVAAGGYGLVTSGGNTQAKSDAKSKITNALIGLIIVLAAWILVDTLSRGLLASDDGTLDGSMPWNDIQCGVPPVLEDGSNESPSSDGSSGGTSGGTQITSGGSFPAPCSSCGGLDGAAVFSALSAEGITITSSGGCTDPNQSNCTGLSGIQSTTIDAITDLKDDCGCAINITGGTETGHSTTNPTSNHQSGHKLDISLNPEIDAYIEDNFVDDGTWSDGTQLYRDESNGAIYAKEGNHWDIQYGN